MVYSYIKERAHLSLYHAAGIYQAVMSLLNSSFVSPALMLSHIFQPWLVCLFFQWVPCTQPIRQGEVSYWRRWFHALGYSIISSVDFQNSREQIEGKIKLSLKILGTKPHHLIKWNWNPQFRSLIRSFLPALTSF